jgi:hypothetical protein
MPLHIPDVLKIFLLGTIFPAIAYGIVIILSGNCFHLLQKKRGLYSNRMRIIHLIYVIFMLLCSTWSILQSVWVFMTILTKRIPSYLFFFALECPLAMWGADGFMVRILIIHQEQTKFYNAITDMALFRLVSGRLQRSQGCNNCAPFTHLTRFFW